MKTHRARKCLNCKEFFTPDHRQRDRQKYCSKPECRKASKLDSQKRWLSKPQNMHYFKGPENVQRVQRWRKANPGYSKRSNRKKALQDTLDSEVADNKDDTQSYLRQLFPALQDSREQLRAVFIGFLAHLTGDTLQDEIAKKIIDYHNYGQQILGIGPGIQKGGKR